MSLAHGRHYLAIPGPSVMPDRVLRAMHRAAPNIYEGDFVEMVPGIVQDLKSVAWTSGDVAIYIANGHGAWEAALSNVFSRGDKALALATGRFAIGWAEMARTMGVEVDILDFGKRDPVDTARLSEALAADKGHEIKAILCVQVDTSTSVRNDIASIRAAIDTAGHPALLMVDCIACLGCDAFLMDDWGVDVMVTGSQKGLMTPPGLGFVFFNAKADKARERADCVTHYWDWRPRVAPVDFYQFFDGTAPTHHLYGLREALDMIVEEGLEAIWARHTTLARAIWAAVEVWGQGGPMELNVADPVDRSRAVTSIRAGSPDGTRLREWVESKAGLTLGIGLGMAEKNDPAWHGFFRIGHMGHVNAQMVMGTLGAIEAGMKAIQIPHGSGALSAAAEVLSAGA
jgi:alanine-glyoxylate transaminase/serine-glyoxylate transaminase/serine-pyruvate transaminase